MKKLDILKTKKWLSEKEIEKNLENVEYIVMASPTLAHDESTPIHFTLYLNTQELIPEEIAGKVFNKFLDEHKIIRHKDLIKGIYNVAFSLNDKDTAMPMLFLSDEDRHKSGLASAKMYIFDFEGDGNGFSECKKEGKTGWSYSYN